MICEICGHDHEKNVWKRPDGIARCIKCASKAIYGRYIPDREIMTAPYKKVLELNEQWDNSPINHKIKEN